MTITEDPLELAEKFIGSDLEFMFVGSHRFWGPYRLLAVGEGFLVVQGEHQYIVNLLTVAVMRPHTAIPIEEETHDEPDR